MSTADDNKTPDQIRAQIDATRAGLGYDVDALADKVNPTQIAHRQADRVKSRFTSVRESVMGAVHDKTAGAGSATDSAKDISHQTIQKAKGNPVAVGLVAFGVGWLVSSLVPSSDREQDFAEQVKEKAAPLADQAKSAAQEMAQSLKQPVQEAVASVKETAQDAAETVKDEAQSAASDVKDSAQESKDTLQNP